VARVGFDDHRGRGTRPSGAAGTVTFFPDATDLGSPGTVLDKNVQVPDRRAMISPAAIKREFSASDFGLSAAAVQMRQLT